MKHLLFLLLAVPLLFASCFLNKHLYFTYRDDGRKTGLGRQLKTRGFYIYGKPVKNNHPPVYWPQGDKIPDSVYGAMFLYTDGSIGFYQYFSSKERIKQYFSTADNSTKHTITGEWGRYILAHDTIKAQFNYKSKEWQYAPTENWYKIVNDTTLQYIISIINYASPHKIIVEPRFERVKDKTFVPFASKPDSTKIPDREKSWYHSKRI